MLVHDFAYSDTYFDGFEPPSVLQVPGGKEVAVELYTLTKSFSMAGWRVAFAVGNAEVVGALTKAEKLLGLWDFPAHPDRFDRRPQRGRRLPKNRERNLRVSP